MLHFFIKSTICFALLFAFYKVFLEREKMHHFNRFYLIGVLALSVIIPNVTFYIESSSVNSLNTFAHSLTTSSISNNLGRLLFSVYLVGVLLYGIRFIKNILNIYNRVKRNFLQKESDFKLVLIEENLLPHTFLKYVFVNKVDYNTNNIKDELFVHELVHVKQKHSVDVILSELFQVFFWFNPLVSILKHAIKLNHEFLADQGVIQTYNNTSNYQHILLDIASQPSISGLTSNLNYSLTKKRFNMMVKQSSPITQRMLIMASIPILLLTLMAFSDISTSNKHEKNEHEKSESIFSNNSEHVSEHEHH